MALAGRPRASVRILQPGRAGLGGRHKINIMELMNFESLL